MSYWLSMNKLFVVIFRLIAPPIDEPQMETFYELKNDFHIKLFGGFATNFLFLRAQFFSSSNGEMKTIFKLPTFVDETRSKVRFSFPATSFDSRMKQTGEETGSQVLFWVEKAKTFFCNVRRLLRESETDDVCFEVMSIALAYM